MVKTVGVVQWGTCPLAGSHWDEKTKPNWYLHMELQMDSNLGLMKELTWVLLLAPLKDIMMASLMVHLMGYHWNDNTDLHSSSDGAVDGFEIRIDEGTELSSVVGSSEGYND